MTSCLSVHDACCYLPGVCASFRMWVVLGFLFLGTPAGLLLSGQLLPEFYKPAVAAVAATPAPSLLLLSFGLLLLGALWLHRVCSRPLEHLKGPDELGYIPEPGRSRAEVANDVRRRRKKGDLPPVYPNGWYQLMDSHLLPPSEVRSLTVLGEQVAVFRTKDGEVFVVDAYCPHLGANLAVGGLVVGDCLECPFHGWQFNGADGKCKRIPYSDKVPDFAKIKTWPTCEINGMVHVWYHCDGIDPTWEIPEQEKISSKEWVYRGRTEHYVDSHIEEIPENAADLAHLSHLHCPAIVTGVDLRYTFSKKWDFVKHTFWKVQWHPESEPNKHCSQLFLEHRLFLFGKHFSLLDVHVVARQVGPGLVFLTFKHAIFGSGIIIQCVTPVEPLLQKVSHSIYYQENMPTLIPKFILKAECIQFERDLMIWNNKKFTSKPLLVKEDSAIQRHRRWYAQFYSENSPKLYFQKESLDW